MAIRLRSCRLALTIGLEQQGETDPVQAETMRRVRG